MTAHPALASSHGKLAQIVPGATYRLQFNEEFGFRDAARIIPYLRSLGITDCYASPLFQPAPGSTHGYDVCGFEQINAKLGGPEDFEQFISVLQEHRMGLLLDMVPNHMGNDLSNAWWRDVLEWGPQSRFASFFDIAWQPLELSGSETRPANAVSSPSAPQGESALGEQPFQNPPRVLLPILEDHLGKVLDSGKIQLRFDHGSFFVGYYNKDFPVSPSSYRTIVTSILEWLGQNDPADDLHSRLRELSGKFQEALHARGYVSFEQLKQELGKLEQNSKRFRAGLQAALQQFNGVAGQPSTFDRLQQLLQQQHFRLAYWRIASEEINYRRFFDVTELVSLTMELPEVFQASHCLVFRLLAEGKITGLRIDHPDGLWDPKTYFDRLQESFTRLCPPEKGKEASNTQKASKSSDASTTPALYVVAEKILTDNEPLPEDWAVSGTTGYEFLNVLNGVFVDANNEARFNHIYREFTGKDKSFAATVYAGKKRVLEKSLISEINTLAHRLKLVASMSRYSQDLTLAQLRRMLIEVISCFPVYRTYVTEQTRSLPAVQRSYVDQAINAAKQHGPASDHPVLEFIHDLLTLSFPRDLDDKGRHACRQFILKFQQLSGPATAKGVEDTAFYRYHRLISLNEVGGNPGRFGVSISHFHEFNQQRAHSWPHSLLATATHDTKRGEDLRATVNVLSEIPAEWEKAVYRWRDLNQSKKPVVAGKPAPDSNDEYLLYQTLIGAWPGAGRGSDWKVKEPDPSEASKSFRDRIAEYMLKAIKEAKLNTSWTEPNPAYEAATKQFVEAILDRSNRKFVEDFSIFHSGVAFFGRLNSLSQLLLKIASPGVPDFYQGTEFWDLNLVDPDNRRPVAYTLRQRLLTQLDAKGEPGNRGLVEEMTKKPWDSGLIKLYVLSRALRFRNANRDLFERGDYVPLEVVGPKNRNVCAFARVYESKAAVIIVPRFVYSLLNGRPELPLGSDTWQETYLRLSVDYGSFRNIFTGEDLTNQKRGSVSVGQSLATFPLALLSQA